MPPPAAVARRVSRRSGPRYRTPAVGTASTGPTGDRQRQAHPAAQQRAGDDRQFAVAPGLRDPCCTRGGAPAGATGADQCIDGMMTWAPHLSTASALRDRPRRRPALPSSGGHSAVSSSTTLPVAGEAT